MRNLKELKRPRSLEEFWDAKDQYGSRAVVIAGGTDLVSDPPDGVECLIDVRKLGLDRIVEEEGAVTLGATTTMEALSRSPVVAALARGLLSRSSCQGWPAPVRSAATLGGNLAGGDPFADTPAALLALDAQAVLHNREGERRVPMSEFFLDYRKTAAEDSILLRVIIPKTPAEALGAFLKCAPGHIDKAMVNVAVYGELVEGRCRNVRVAVGAVTRIPHRIGPVEALLEGEELHPELIEQAAETVSRSVEPMLDMRASVEQRRSLLGMLFKRAVHQLGRTA